MDLRMVDERVVAEAEGRVGTRGAGPSPAARSVPPAPAELGLDRRRLLDFDSSNPRMRELLHLARRAVAVPVPLLILGETGVGKGHLAEAIHNDGPRAEQPFVLHRCGTVPPDLEASELFGHVRGAFTGATRQRRGVFEQAHGGTILIDEIGELSLPSQIKLLWVLDERRIQRVGGQQPLSLDVRVMVATNRDLKAEVAAGRFRKDLLFRFSVLPLEVPPLRSHAEDVERLAYRFLDHYRQEFGTRAERIQPEVLRALEAYPWPGNVRELRSAILHAVTLCPGPEVGLHHLPATLRAPSRETKSGPAPARPSVVAAARRAPPPPPGRNGRDVPSMDDILKQAERQGIEHALKAFDGNVAQAAKALGRSRGWLVGKMRKHGLDRKEFLSGNGKAGPEPP
ncbi:MAG: sigma-54-dependent Fis family transcriptional regulator [Planctomycetes bacterium]|nr:sigma-54-dependent Fis family transcriptional regulator [Planctomycetota bacterium]